MYNRIRLLIERLELKGMPNEWMSYLQKSSLTLNEKLQNPQAVIDALDFYDHQLKNSSSKYMYSSDKSIALEIIQRTFKLDLITRFAFSFRHINDSTA